MGATLHAPSGLYPNLLGDSWRGLDDAVRRLHASGGTVRAIGVFHVRHGSSRLARALAWLARLPAAEEAVEVRLEITAGEEGETWRRAFAGRPLVSRQYRRPDGLLAERVGLAELRFRLEVAGGALSYRTAGAALCFGPWRVPLPRWFGPCVTAREWPAGEGVEVSVEVSFPWLGRLIAYGGKLTRVEVPG